MSEHVGRVLVFQGNEDPLVQGNAQPALFMQRRDGFVERLADLQNLIALLLKIGIVLFGSESERRFEVFQKLRFIEFGRMQFQAELSQSDGIQPLFDDGKRRLFFRHEQHLFPCIRQLAMMFVMSGSCPFRAARAGQR